MSETARLAPVRFRGRGFVLRPRWYGSLAAFVLIIALWQAAGSFGWISPLFLPSPFAIVQALIALAASGELVQHIAASAMRIGVGWALGVGRIGSITGPVLGGWLLAQGTAVERVFWTAAIPASIATLAAVGIALVTRSTKR